ncbi:MAG: ATP-binding cassette domain-containing protein [Planctomycetota bacterium]|jgi:iron(III) transport system ATP-binding protein|nr:ATP-binding cassette domain-containing protein [Planctomycetota bacterium]
MTVQLELRNIAKSYGDNQVLADLDLRCRKGEFLVILGPSGCGKTTLLSIISGILSPDSGRVFSGGRDITSLPPEKRNFGMVFQSYALFPNLRVVDNILYGLKRSQWSKTAALDRALELMELTGISPLADRYPATLSGGQQQRVALARALAPKPEVLLLDEPLSSLDAKVRSSLALQLRELQRRTGVAAVMVTHDQGEAFSMADRIVLLNKGRVEQEGTPEQLYGKPASLFAADFVGRMNILSVSSINDGILTGIRYEDVQVSAPTEMTLGKPHTWVARIERVAFMGQFCRLELLLNDFSTRIFADVLFDKDKYKEQSLVAISLPRDRWCHFSGETDA